MRDIKILIYVAAQFDGFRSLLKDVIPNERRDLLIWTVDVRYGSFSMLPHVFHTYNVEALKNI